jgi:hypothetical protein
MTALHCDADSSSFLRMKRVFHAALALQEECNTTKRKKISTNNNVYLVLRNLIPGVPVHVLDVPT